MKKIIICGCQEYYINFISQQPFDYQQDEINQLLNAQSEFFPCEKLSQSKEICLKKKAEVIILIPDWRENPLKAKEILKEIRQKKKQVKIIFLDPHAQSSTFFFELLPYVDHFLKRQNYRKNNWHLKKFQGGNYFTNYVQKKMKIPLNEWQVYSKPDKKHLHKIQAGWNLGVAAEFYNQLKTQKTIPYEKKTFDIFCRISLGSHQHKEWYYHYRQKALNALEPLKNEFKLTVGGGFSGQSLLPKEKYLSDLAKSKIVFSPFGWGEVCWRDFEAICNNCLLIKPDMSHLQSNPNIYKAKKTYVPVAWDFSNLVKICKKYLNNPQKTKKIIQNAHINYQNFFKNKQFIKILAKLIN